MATKYFDRARFEIGTLGTGTITIGDVADDAFVTPAQAGVVDGDEVTVLIEEAGDFEIRRGVIATGKTEITLGDVLLSKISGVPGTVAMYLDGDAIGTLIASAEDVNAFNRLNNAFWSKTGDNEYTADHTFSLLDDVGGFVVMNKPTAANLQLPPLADTDQEIGLVKNQNNAAAVTIVPFGGETIEGLTSITIPPGGSAKFWPNDAKNDWRMVRMVPAIVGSASSLGLGTAANYDVDNFTSDITFVSTDTTPIYAPNIGGWRNNPTPLDGDLGARFFWDFNNDALVRFTGAEIRAILDDASASTEDVSLSFRVRGAGALAEYVRMDSNGISATSIRPLAPNSSNLGAPTVQFGSLYLAGAVEFNQDFKIWGTTNTMWFTGASVGYQFDSGPVVIKNVTVTNPAKAFNGNTDALQIYGGTSGEAGLALAMFNATAGIGAHFDFYRSRGAVGGGGVVVSGDNLGEINWFASQQTSSFATQSQAARIRVEADGVVTDGAGADMPGRMIFSTTPDGSATPTDRLILDSAGILKFGSTAGQTGAKFVARFNATDANYNQIEFGGSSAGGFQSILGMGVSGAMHLVFHGHIAAASDNITTLGIKASILKDNAAGGFLFGTVAAANTANQAFVQTLGLDSAGVLTMSGSLVLVAGTAPTAEGAVQWNTTTDALLVGSGAATKTFRPNEWETISVLSTTAVASVAWTGLSAFRRLRLSGWLIPATDGVSCMIRTDANGGASFDAGASDYTVTSIRDTGTTVAGASGNVTGILLNVGANLIGNVAPEGVWFAVEAHEFNQARRCFFNINSSWLDQSTVLSSLTGGGFRNDATARDALQILFDSGNIAQGLLTLEGIRG